MPRYAVHVLYNGKDRDMNELIWEWNGETWSLFCCTKHTPLLMNQSIFTLQRDRTFVQLWISSTTSYKFEFENKEMAIEGYTNVLMDLKIPKVSHNMEWEDMIDMYLQNEEFREWIQTIKIMLR